jgi:hypothetical protein
MLRPHEAGSPSSHSPHFAVAHKIEKTAMDTGQRKFLRLFPDGFHDEAYLARERDHKWRAHLEWEAQLSRPTMRTLLAAHGYREIAARALRVEAGHRLLFPLEKMVLEDAIADEAGARIFAEGLCRFLHGPDAPEERFAIWCEAIQSLARGRARILTWPLATVFGFIAQPERHLFLKPNTSRAAARALCHSFSYAPRPNWQTYGNYLALAGTVKKAVAGMHPRDMIDIQSFLWVQSADDRL